MDFFKCEICGDVLDVEGDDIEYDEEENTYCSACFMNESDIGE